MEVESQLTMSLDDIINKHKKERPVGNKKQQVLPFLSPQVVVGCSLFLAVARSVKNVNQLQFCCPSKPYVGDMMYCAHSTVCVCHAGQARTEGQTVTKGWGKKSQKACSARKGGGKWQQSKSAHGHSEELSTLW